MNKISHKDDINQIKSSLKRIESDINRYGKLKDTYSKKKSIKINSIKYLDDDKIYNELLEKYKTVKNLVKKYSDNYNSTQNIKKNMAIHRMLF